MKKYTYFLCLFLVAVLLNACVVKPVQSYVPITDPTLSNPTVPTAATVPTAPTVPITPAGTPADVNLMPVSIYGNEAFQTFLTEEKWYYWALNCTFENPGEISAEFFYNSLADEDIMDNTAFNNEERLFLHNVWSQKYGEKTWLNARKMPVAKLNAALAVLNITVNDMKLPDNWVYYDKTDAFYAYITETEPLGVENITVTKVVRNSNNVQIYWQTDKPHRNTATGAVWAEGVKMVMTLKKHSYNEGHNWSYVIVSNVPGEYNPLTFAELNTAEDFTAFIKQEYWCLRALGCTFEKPEDISAWHYFYTGVEKNDGYMPISWAEGEEAAVKAAYKEKFGQEPWVDCIKLPVAEINRGLAVLGITIKDIKIPDRWLYYEKTDSYYFWVSDAYLVEGWTVTEVVKNTDGTVQLHWESKKGIWDTQTDQMYPDGTKMVMTMQGLEDGTYKILSNMPAN